MSTFQGRVAVVTGAGSGIGRALALELAGRGAKLALSDINGEAVAETAGLVEQRRRGTEVHHTTLDVSDRDAIAAYAETVAAHYGVVHQIYNNAGIAFSRSVLATELADYERVLSINLWGVIAGTKAFLPHLIKSGEGHVINISSLNGIMAQPELSAYCTAKFGVRGFTETLRMEMLASHTPVNVTVVHPGGVKTNIANLAAEAEKATGNMPASHLDARTKLYNEKLLKMPPETAAKIIVDAVAKNKPRIVVGNDAKALDYVVRLAPARFQAPVVKYFAKLAGGKKKR